MKLGLDMNGGICVKISLIENYFGVTPQKMKRIIQQNKEVFKECEKVFGSSIYDFILRFVRPWECPGGTGPAMIAYGRCVPKTYREKWITENEHPGMYELNMLKDYYEVKNLKR